MSDPRPIGVFDSGIGKLTVAKALESSDIGQASKREHQLQERRRQRQPGFRVSDVTCLIQDCRCLRIARDLYCGLVSGSLKPT
jgi:hypothetical protein